MTCQKFRQRFVEQQVKYRSAYCKYLGDEQFQSFTKLSKNRREKRISRLAEASDRYTCVSYQVWYDVKYPRGRSKVRQLCSYDLNLLKTHLHPFLKVTKGKWQVCGTGPVFCRCMLCPGQPHVYVRTGRQKHGTTFSCWIDLHNDDFFGLTLMDCMKLFNEMQKK